jgi:uncharacterized protein
MTPAGSALEAWLATTVPSRLAGLAWTRALPDGRGLLLPRCRAVHTVGMRFAIDVAFLSWPPVRGGCEVISLHAAVPPLRMVAARGAGAVLEATAGALAGSGVVGGAAVTVRSWPVDREPGCICTNSQRVTTQARGRRSTAS